MQCVSVSQSQQMKISTDHEESLKNPVGFYSGKPKETTQIFRDVVLAFLQAISQHCSTRKSSSREESKSLKIHKKANLH